MDLFQFDDVYRQKGYPTLAGLDEAGRGPWAGPVVAAAVILPETCSIPGLDDSKKLSPLQRDKLYDAITAQAVSYGIGIVDHEKIDEINILRATHLAMSMALENIRRNFDLVLIDGLPVSGISYPQEAIIRGDGQSACIAAASILAKVTRDRIMIEASKEYPQFDFHSHKGYGTKAHHEALKKHGPCPIHRRSFNPIKEMV